MALRDSIPCGISHLGLVLLIETDNDCGSRMERGTLIRLMYLIIHINQVLIKCNVIHIDLQ